MADTILQTVVDEQGQIMLVPVDTPPEQRRALLALLASAAGKLFVRVSVDAAGIPRLHSIPSTAEEAEHADWMKLAESSMDFWDNPEDDAAWNNA